MKKELMTVYGDGVRDDTDALQAFFDGKADLIHDDGTEFKGCRNLISGDFGGQCKNYKITKALHIGR